MSQRDVKWLFLRQQEVHTNTNSGRNSEPDKSILEVLLYLEFRNAVFL